MSIVSALEHQHDLNLEPSEQFWYLAARIVPRLSAALPNQYRRRTRIMSTILARDLKGLKENILNRSEKAYSIEKEPIA